VHSNIKLPKTSIISALTSSWIQSKIKEGSKLIKVVHNQKEIHLFGSRTPGAHTVGKHNANNGQC